MSSHQRPTPGKAPAPTKSQHVQVFVRVRPANQLEQSHKSASIISIPGPKTIIVQDHTSPKLSKSYAFDGVFGPSTHQEHVYQRVVEQAVADVLEGYNCTVFAYGQTGTGKTYTMEGDISNGDRDSKAGITPRALSALFDELRLNHAEYTIRMAYLEIYNEELYDLLAGDEKDEPAKLRLYDDPMKKGSVIVQGLEECVAHSISQAFKILQKGVARRQVAATKLNALSSRSHAVLCITVHTRENSVDGEGLVKIGKLNLVDLAGSENVGRSGSVDKRAREAGNINQSLLTLGRVISCLVERQPHVPYRESKLTRLLQDSLGGRTKTSIIATVSPSAMNLDETLSTLDYAMRAKSVSNKPEVNQVSKEAILKEYSVLIEGLKKKLELSRGGSGIYLAVENYQEYVDRIEARKKELAEKTAEMRHLASEKKKYEMVFDEMARELVSKEQELQQVKFEFQETSERVKESQVVVEEERHKLSETKTLVNKAGQYEMALQGHAKKCIELIGDAEQHSDKLHSRLDKSKDVEENNTQHAMTFKKEYSLLVESFERKISEFAFVRVPLEALLDAFCDVRADTEMRNMEALLISTLDKVYETLATMIECWEEQNNYRNNWNKETSTEVKEISSKQIQRILSLDSEMKHVTESYKKITDLISKSKSPLVQSIRECVLDEWLKCMENTSSSVSNGLSSTEEHCLSTADEIVEHWNRVEDASQVVLQQNSRFDQEYQNATEVVRGSCSGFNGLIEEHVRNSKNSAESFNQRVQENSDLFQSSLPLLAQQINSCKEDSLRLINDLSFAAPSLRDTVIKQTKAWDLKDVNANLQQMEISSESSAIDNVDAWNTLTASTEEALKMRHSDSVEALEANKKCAEELREQIAELNRQYAAGAKKIVEQYAKVQEKNNVTFDNLRVTCDSMFTDLTEQLKVKSLLVDHFITDQLRKDRSSGLTPARKIRNVAPLEDPLATPDRRRIVDKVLEDRSRI